MLPIGKKWYRNLIVFSIVLGIVGAFSAIAYTGVTDFGINFFFGDAGTDWWSGNWWWVPLTALGGLLVAEIRRIWSVPKDVPGGVEAVGNPVMKPKRSLQYVLISVVSVILGASLGPSFGFILLGGAAGSWIVTKLKIKDKEAQEEFALTGMSGATGGAFSAPLFAAILVSEASPTKKENYVQVFIPMLIAATVGYVIFYNITGSTIFGLFTLPPFEYETSQILTATLLGFVAAFVLLVFALVSLSVNKAMKLLKTPRQRGIIGGSIVGLITFALPLTAGAGTGQLNQVLETPGAWGVLFLLIVLLAKMVAISLSLESGFLGGNVFPIIFVGGVAGVILFTLFPGLGLTFTVAVMLTAVPGAFLKLPLTLILISAGTIGLVASATIPLAISFVVAHLTMSVFRAVISKNKAQTSTS